MNIVIIGNSIISLRLVESIKSHAPETNVVLLSQQKVAPYRADFIADFIAQRCLKDQFYYCQQEFYDSKKVRLISAKKIARINLNKKQVALDDKEKIDYDKLVISDTGVFKFPEIKGVNKTGVYGIKYFYNYDEFLKQLFLVESIVIQSTNLKSLKLAAALQERGKEVIVCVKKDSVLARWLNLETAGFIKGILEKGNLRIMEDAEITEILGDSEAKAIRLKSGKVFASQVVLFDEQRMDFRYFKDTALKMEERIIVDEFYRTNVENVFAIGSPTQSCLTEKLDDLELIEACWEKQAQQLGNILFDNFTRMEISGFGPQENRLVIKDQSLYFLGTLQADFTFTSMGDLDLEGGRGVFLCSSNARVVGAILVNRDDLLQTIKEGLVKDIALEDLLRNLGEEGCPQLAISNKSSENICCNDEQQEPSVDPIDASQR